MRGRARGVYVTPPPPRVAWPGLAWPGMGWQARYELLLSVLQDHAPELYKHLDAEEVLPHGRTLFFMEWCVTLFCKRLELDVVGTCLACVRAHARKGGATRKAKHETTRSRANATLSQPESKKKNKRSCRRLLGSFSSCSQFRWSLLARSFHSVLGSCVCWTACMRMQAACGTCTSCTASR